MLLIFNIINLKTCPASAGSIILNIILFILLFFPYPSAGAPDTLWTKTYGGTGFDFGYSVQQTSDGGFIIAGSTMSFSNSEDIYLIKVDSKGDTLWTKTYGGADQEKGYSVQQTSDGGFIVSGMTRSFGAGGVDVYLLRTNTNGDTLWAKTYGGAQSDEGNSVQQMNDGGFIITGVTGGRTCLIRTNSNGDTLWTRAYNGHNSCLGRSVHQTKDGGSIIAGEAWAFNPGLDCDVFLIRADSNGDTLWTKKHGGENFDYGYSIQQTTNGDFVIAGCTMSSGADDEDVYLIRTDSNGDTVWTKTYGGDTLDFGYSVQQTSDGGFIITGSTISYGAGEEDVYLIRANSNGDTLWTKTYGGAMPDIGHSVRQTHDGGFIIAGRTESFGTGESDIYLIRIDTTTIGIQKDLINKSHTLNDFIISHDYRNKLISFCYTLLYPSSVKLEAYDIQGKLIKVIIDKFMHKGSYTEKWDTKQNDNKLVAGGVYFLKLSANGSAVSKKVTIIK